MTRYYTYKEFFRKTGTKGYTPEYQKRDKRNAKARARRAQRRQPFSLW